MTAGGGAAAAYHTAADSLIKRGFPWLSRLNGRRGRRPPQGICFAVSSHICGTATRPGRPGGAARSEEHTSELQSLMRISYAVFCLKKKKQTRNSSNRYLAHS